MTNDEKRGICEIFFYFCSLPDGLENVSDFPNLFAVLLDMEWTQEELEKLAQKNLIRAMREMEAVSATLSLLEEPKQAWIEETAFKTDEMNCMSELAKEAVAPSGAKMARESLILTMSLAILSLQFPSVK